MISEEGIKEDEPFFWKK